MKLYKLFTTLLIATAFTACADYEDVIVPSPVVSDNVQAVRFASTNKTTFELDPNNELSVSLKVIRNAANSAAAAEIPVEVVSNANDNFVVPSTVSFAAGDSTATLKIMTSASAPVGEDMTFEIKIADEQVNPYKAEYASYKAKVIIVKWNNLGKVHFYDSFAFSTATASYAVEVTLEQRDDKKNFYRINFPYSAGVLEAAEWTGWIGGNTQSHIVFNVGATYVTWDGFWYTNLIYDGVATDPIKAYLPSAIGKTDDKQSTVKKDTEGNILYLALKPYYYVDGVGGWGMKPTYLSFPGYDLLGALNLTVFPGL